MTLRLVYKRCRYSIILVYTRSPWLDQCKDQCEWCDYQGPMMVQISLNICIMSGSFTVYDISNLSLGHEVYLHLTVTPGADDLARADARYRHAPRTVTWRQRPLHQNILRQYRGWYRKQKHEHLPHFRQVPVWRRVGASIWTVCKSTKIIQVIYQ